MKCPEFQVSLHHLFIGEATPDEKKRVETHAASCARCAALLETARELSCKEFVEFLGEYVDEVIPIERRKIFERHLAICPDCTAYLASYRRTIEMTRASADVDVKAIVEGMPEELVVAIVESLKRK